ncbi:GntR family transcriptional regulator [Rariglobus hedericola]|uniref:GntR family transcriptional regulator n=1 Tax=Rariglobus hedericola TaxID=2597822 RepID=A0A556QKX3_9BACT|nr:GntR family transcriptional regulator [Rariglobus hedericola]TSJ77294.1 GntR family transcriptional regulator [Rariglobus hedericola]
MATGKLVSDATRQLNDWLEAGKFKEGDRLPSERAIAKELGVKYYGLNRAMGRLISEGRVLREGYRLSIAVAPRVSRRMVFHLIVARRTHHLASYRRAAANLDIELVVHDWVAAEEVASILNQLDSKETAGVVCDPPSESVHATDWLPAALQLIRHGIPVVCTGGWGLNGELSAVGANVNNGVTLALSHLLGLAHRELALVTFPAGSEREMSVLDYWNRLCVRNQLGSSTERILLQPSWLTEERDIDDLVELLVTGPWNNVTGLVILVGYNTDIQSLFTKLARRGRRVPESLSVVVVGNAKALASAEPRVSAAGFDMVLWFELTFDLLLREVHEQRQLGVPREPSSIQMMPRLVVRESTRALEGAELGPKAAAFTSESAAVTKDIAHLERLAKQPYPLAAKASLSELPRFTPVDLRPFVNRPLIFRRGWLGDIPLRCLAPGTHEIQGVPFEILGGPNRANGGAVIFQSTTNTTGNARKLPDRLVIPINGPVEAVYILHGCGYAKPMQPFAHYRFHANKRVIGNVPLVSLGWMHAAASGDPGLDKEKPSANIQDWWPDFLHQDFPHARVVPLLENDETNHVNRHVFLYTLEWINPTPKQPLTHIEIQADPTVPTTLGLLAITVVRPRTPV